MMLASSSSISATLREPLIALAGAVAYLSSSVSVLALLLQAPNHSPPDSRVHQRLKDLLDMVKVTEREALQLQEAAKMRPSTTSVGGPDSKDTEEGSAATPSSSVPMNSISLVRDNARDVLDRHFREAMTINENSFLEYVKTNEDKLNESTPWLAFTSGKFVRAAKVSIRTGLLGGYTPLCSPLTSLCPPVCSDL